MIPRKQPTNHFAPKIMNLGVVVAKKNVPFVKLVFYWKMSRAQKQNRALI